MNRTSEEIKNTSNLILESYVSKEELLKIISELNFIGIEYARFDMVISIVYDAENDQYRTRTKSITID